MAVTERTRTCTLTTIPFGDEYEDVDIIAIVIKGFDFKEKIGSPSLGLFVLLCYYYQEENLIEEDSRGKKNGASRARAECRFLLEILKIL